jgi:hypothetical protein
MAQTSDSANSTAQLRGGRPPEREISAQDLLERYVPYELKQRRLGHARSRAGFAKALDKSAATLRGYLKDYNFPWPLVDPTDLVCLIDVTVPHELKWVSHAWCELVGCSREDLLYQPVATLRASGFADGPRHVHAAAAAYLRAHPQDSRDVEGWLTRADGQLQTASFEMRYGHASHAYYIRATLLEVSVSAQPPLFNVVPNVILRRKAADSVDLVELEHLLERAIGH